MFDTIHHIAIIGSDYEKSKHFYVDLLGFKVIRENYRKERDDYKIDLACGLQERELFIVKNAPARVNYPEALGLRHLAFKVESVDDTVKELNGKGIETEPVRLDDYTGKKMTFFHDPDGLPLEIHEYASISILLAYSSTSRSISLVLPFTIPWYFSISIFRCAALFIAKECTVRLSGRSLNISSKVS